MKKNILIIGGTSGIMITCIERFLKKDYKIFASYNNEDKLKNFPSKIKDNKNITFFKLNLLDDNKKIIKIFNDLKVEIDIIINAVGGSFGTKEYPFDMKDWIKLLELNILKHILINNIFRRAKSSSSKPSTSISSSPLSSKSPTRQFSTLINKPLLELQPNVQAIFHSNRNQLMGNL